MNVSQSYVLLTTAKNESAYIGLTLQSVISQTILPIQWIIIDDGSSDSTLETINNFAKKVPFITVIARQPGTTRDFGSKAFALKDAYQHLDKSLPYKFIGFLDADVSFNPDFFKQLIGEFESDPGPAFWADSFGKITMVNGSLRIVIRNGAWEARPIFSVVHVLNKPGHTRHCVMAERIRLLNILPVISVGRCALSDTLHSIIISHR